MHDPSKMRKLKRKSYRTAYLDAHVRTRLAFQIRAIRKQLGLSQYDFAKNWQAAKCGSAAGKSRGGPTVVDDSSGSGARSRRCAPRAVCSLQ